MASRIFVTRRVPEAGLELLRSQGAEVEVAPEDRPIRPDELLAAVRDRDGVLCHLTDPVDQAVLAAAAPRCRVFATYAVGYNNIDIAAATALGIVVTHTPDVLTETTADLAWALLMSAARRIVESDAFVRSGRWTGWGPMQFLGQDVYRATLGIIGPGRIGTAVARRGRGFDMPVLYVARGSHADLESMDARRVELDTLLAESDFVSLHVPLTPETRHLIGARELGLMKPTAVLINTARGPVVDEAALVTALREGRIAAAGLDVYENEPQPAPGLTELPNVVCISHLGSATRGTRTEMSLMAARNLLAGMAGKRPPNPINPEALAKRPG